MWCIVHCAHFLKLGPSHCLWGRPSMNQACVYSVLGQHHPRSQNGAPPFIRCKLMRRRSGREREQAAPPPGFPLLSLLLSLHYSCRRMNLWRLPTIHTAPRVSAHPSSWLHWLLRLFIMCYPAINRESNLHNYCLKSISWLFFSFGRFLYLWPKNCLWVCADALVQNVHFSQLVFYLCPWSPF